MVPKAVSALLILLLHSIHMASSNKPRFTDDELQGSYGSVVYATIIFRHGDRTPIKTYPTDHIPITYWKEGPGQLTIAGKKRAYDLGEWFRHRYEHLLPVDAYRHDRVLVNSSDVDRTIMSGELFLAGLYPPNENETWNEQLAWQPVPLHTIPKPLDNMISSDGRRCDRYELEKDLLNKSPEMEALFEEHRTIIQYVSTRSGLPMTKVNILEAINLFADVYDALFVETQNNLSIPNWADTVYPESMKPLAAFSFSTIAYTDEMRRLKGGPLLKSVVDDFTAKAAGGLANRTFHIYSGHDTTVAVFLDTLDIFNQILPPYSCAILVELRKKENDYFVSVSYRNTSEAAPYLLKIPECSRNVCTLHEFVEACTSKIPENWEQECALESDYKALVACYGVLFFLTSAAFVVLANVFLPGGVNRNHRYQTIGL